MHAEHAIGRFAHGCLTRACRVMAGVIRLERDLSELGIMFRWGPYGTRG